MTSQSFVFSSGPTFWKQPAFIATLVSVGIHGVIFTQLNLKPAPIEESEELRSIEVVELSPSDLQRLPAFAQPTSPLGGQSSAFPGFPDPTALPMPDMSLDLGALAALGATAPQGNPRSQSAPLVPQFNFSDWLPPAPSTLPPPPPLPNVPLPNIRLDQPTFLPQLPAPPAAAPSSEPTPRASATPPTNLTPNTTPPVAPSPQGGVSGSAQDLLPPDSPGDDSASAATPAPTPAPDPYADLRDRYSRYSTGATDPGAASGQLASWLEAKRLETGNPELAWTGGPQALSLGFPDALCPSDAGSAWVLVLVDGGGTALEVNVVMETGYATLDEAARLYIRRMAHPQPATGTEAVYQYSLTFTDQGGCEVFTDE
ncbi:energy transducer TonB [Prochlorothrix hollandica]|nr:hypothetical protein [Prochlorothrix hollandica]